MTVTQVCVFVNLCRETAVHLQALSLNLALTLKFLTLMSLSLIPKPKTTRTNPGHLWLEPPVLCHWATTAGQPPTLTILYVYCTGGTKCSVTHLATTQYVLSQNSVRAALATLATFQFIALSLCSYVNSLNVLSRILFTVNWVGSVQVTRCLRITPGIHTYCSFTQNGCLKSRLSNFKVVLNSTATTWPSARDFLLL